MGSSPTPGIMRLEVEVTDQDIKAADGHAGEYHKCPVAQSLMRQGFSDLQVDSDYILCTQDDKTWKFKTPAIAQVLIEDFDDCKKVSPMSFILEKPSLACAEDYYRNKPLIADTK